MAAIPTFIEEAAQPPQLLALLANDAYLSFQLETWRVADAAAPLLPPAWLQVCRGWEEAAQKADCRTVVLRTGIVLARDGGALGKMIPVFSIFAGGPLGSGRQWCSWIHRWAGRCRPWGLVPCEKGHETGACAREPAVEAHAPALHAWQGL